MRARASLSPTLPAVEDSDHLKAIASRPNRGIRRKASRDERKRRVRGRRAVSRGAVGHISIDFAFRFTCDLYVTGIYLGKVVGAAGFEPAAPCAQGTSNAFSCDFLRFPISA